MLMLWIVTQHRNHFSVIRVKFRPYISDDSNDSSPRSNKMSDETGEGIVQAKNDDTSADAMDSKQRPKHFSFSVNRLVQFDIPEDPNDLSLQKGSGSRS